MWHSNGPALLGFWPYVDEVACPVPPLGPTPGLDDAFELQSIHVLEEFAGENKVHLCTQVGTFETIAYIYREADLMPADPPASRKGWRAAIHLISGLELVTGLELVDVYGRRFLLEERTDGDDWQDIWTIIEKS